MRSFDADQAARALLHAAIHTDELSVLIKHDASALRGAVPLRARWIAFAALMPWEPQVHALARALGCGADGLYLLERQRQRTDWCEAWVTAVAMSVFSDTPPAAPVSLERAMAAELAARGGHG